MIWGVSATAWYTLVLGGGRWGLGRGSAVAARRIRRIAWEDGIVRVLPAESAAAPGPGGRAGDPGPGMVALMIET